MVERERTGEVFLVTYSTRDANGTSMRPSCDYNLKEGESYLIYASGKQNKLRTNHCMRTRRLTKADEDLKRLGEGKEPVEMKDKPNKPLNTGQNSDFQKNRRD